MTYILFAILATVLFVVTDYMHSLAMYPYNYHTIIGNWRDTSMRKWVALGAAFLGSVISVAVLVSAIIVFSFIAIAEGNFFPNFFGSKPFKKD